MLDYLGQFSAPGMVREYLEAADRKEVDKREVQLADVEKQPADSEGGFLSRLDDLPYFSSITAVGEFLCTDFMPAIALSFDL